MLYSFLFATLFSVVSLIGILVFKITKASQSISYLLALSAGALIADSVFHLLPHATEEGFSQTLGITFLSAILVNFLIESYLRWRECCKLENESSKKHLGVLNLFGDCMCNFIDGISLISSFAVSPAAGIATGIAILLHEIPQEMGDFATLIHSGFTKKKAVYLNIAVSLLTFVGILVGQFLLSISPEVEKYLIVFAAGSITYLALSNLIPEVHTFHKKGVNWASILCFILGMVIIWGITFLEPAGVH